MSAADRFSLRRPSRALAAILVVAVGVWAGPAGAGTAKDKEKPPENGAPANPGNGNGNGNGKDKEKQKDQGAPNNGNGNGNAGGNGNGNGGGQPGGDPGAPSPDQPVDGDAGAAGGTGAFPADDDPAQAALGTDEEGESPPMVEENSASTDGDGNEGGAEDGASASGPAPEAPKPESDAKPSLPPPSAPAPSRAPTPVAPGWTQPLPLSAPGPKPKTKQTHDQRVLGRWHSSRSKARVVHGVNGAAAVEVTSGNARGRFTLVTAKPLVADRIPYRVNAWLRTDTPGLTVCLRFVEKQPGWKGKRVRSSETCIAPTTEWKRFRVDALSVTRGNVLRVAAVVYGSFGDASFELSRLKVEKKVDGRWTKIRGAKRTPEA